MVDVNKFIVKNDLTIRQAVKKMDSGGIGFSVCVDSDNNVIGVLSNGDFRRAILNGVDLNNSIEEIINRDFVCLSAGYSEEDVKELFSTTVAQHIPVIENSRLLSIITEEEFYNIKYNVQKNKKLNLPVVIMAGGKGTRLDPFTRILPKPLIPIGDKSIIEVIMDMFAKFGMNQFTISVNHKSKMIKAYFEEQESGYEISYIQEDKPLGTAGSLKLLEGSYDTPFFVSNCDILIKDDYSKIYDFHKENNYAITIVASMQHHVVSYGVCEIENGGNLKKIVEKPQYDFLVNTGMYLLNPEVLKFIPDNEFCHITDLIEKLKSKDFRIGVYPISEKSWVDIGQWEEYRKVVSIFNR